jgi:hypothetical protein
MRETLAMWPAMQRLMQADVPVTRVYRDETDDRGDGTVIFTAADECGQLRAFTALWNGDGVLVLAGW